jgi:hypothetical protein
MREGPRVTPVKSDEERQDLAQGERGLLPPVVLASLEEVAGRHGCKRLAAIIERADHRHELQCIGTLFCGRGCVAASSSMRGVRFFGNHLTYPELTLILMFLPDRDQPRRLFDANDAIRFIYDKLYRDAYGGTGVVEIHGFGDYVESVWRRVEMHATRTHLGKLKIDRGLYMGLTALTQREGIGSRLDL